MFIKTLILKKFRNFENLKCQFSEPVTVFTGKNGTGKTNIIEAIHVLSNIKSFRNSADGILVKKESMTYFISGEVSDASIKKMSIGYSREKNTTKKKFIIDNNPVTKPSDYYGNLLSVIICPSDLNIIDGNPDARRRYFDSVISKTDKSYLKYLTDLKRIIHYRNLILKDIRESNNSKKKEIETWDQLFSEKAYYICSKRKEFINNYNITFKAFYEKISNEDDIPYINYSSSFIDKSVEEILSSLKEYRRRDINFGFTTSGPHRDDFKFEFDNSLFIHTASQGQKRTAVIAVKLSEIEIIENITKVKPVVLIDDIFSELDNDRRKNLIGILNRGNQLFFTMVDISVLNGIIEDYTEVKMDTII